MAEKMYTALQLETALCLWEAFIDFQCEVDPETKLSTDFAEKLCELRSNHGSYIMRQAVADLSDDCDTAWEAYKALNGDMLAFDFEFCPTFLRGAIEEGRLNQQAEHQWRVASAA